MTFGSWSVKYIYAIIPAKFRRDMAHTYPYRREVAIILPNACQYPASIEMASATLSRAAMQNPLGL